MRPTAIETGSPDGGRDVGLRVASLLVAFVASSFFAAMATAGVGRLLLPDRVAAPDGLGAIQVGAIAWHAHAQGWRFWGARPAWCLAGVAAALFAASVWRDVGVPGGWFSILGQAALCVVGSRAVTAVCRRAWGG